MIGQGMMKGLYVTLLNLLRPHSTVQYPDKMVGLRGAARSEGVSMLKLLAARPLIAVRALAGAHRVTERNSQSTRFRGNEFTWYEDRCTGCASCAKYCPMGIIEIVTEPGGFDAQEGESYNLNLFDIDIGRCMFCGLCVEACPYDALHMGSNFERAKPSRVDLVIPKEELIANAKRPSTWFRPQLEERGADPFSQTADDHYGVGRHEKPSDEDLNDKWVDKR